MQFLPFYTSEESIFSLLTNNSISRGEETRCACLASLLIYLFLISPNVLNFKTLLHFVHI